MSTLGYIIIPIFLAFVIGSLGLGLSSCFVLSESDLGDVGCRARRLITEQCLDLASSGRPSQARDKEGRRLAASRLVFRRLSPSADIDPQLIEARAFAARVIAPSAGTPAGCRELSGRTDVKLHVTPLADIPDSPMHSAGLEKAFRRYSEAYCLVSVVAESDLGPSRVVVIDTLVPVVPYRLNSDVALSADVLW